MPRHEFETSQGDELSPTDLRNATWLVTETYVDFDDDANQVVFTHRVTPHSLDDLIIEEVK